MPNWVMALAAAAGAAVVLAVLTLGGSVVAVMAALGAPGASLGLTVSPPLGAAGLPARPPAGIPPLYLRAVVAAGERFSVPWSVIAGIYKVECDFGSSPLPGCPRGTRNSVGAQGPGQFLPGTWRASLAPGAIILPGPPAPPGLGFATDGDGDGVADAWDPFDATASTARMLAADGAATNIRRAVFAYNHDDGYVDEVLALAAGYAASAAATGPATSTAGGRG